MDKKLFYLSPEIVFVEIDQDSEFEQDIMNVSGEISGNDDSPNTTGQYDWDDDFFH